MWYTKYFFIFLISFCLQVYADEVIINDEIAEASGIVYSPKQNKLFVVDDEGEIFAMTLDGEIVKKGYLGDYDLEGIALIDDSDALLVSVEDLEKIFVIDSITFDPIREFKLDLSWENETLFSLTNDGIEGITVVDDYLFIANQSDEVRDDFYKPHSPSAIAELRVKMRSRTVDSWYVFRPIYFPYTDLSGLDYFNSHLYVLSDSNDMVAVYSLETNEITDHIYFDSYQDQEGIAIVSKNEWYIAVDGVGVIRKTFD